MLELNDIQAGYGRTLVLHGVTLPRSDGVVAVLGHNGAGKSTLLRVAIGLIKPRSGKVIFDGADVTSLPITREEILRALREAEATGRKEPVAAGAA